MPTPIPSVNDVLGEWSGYKAKLDTLQAKFNNLEQAAAATKTEASGYQERLKALETQSTQSAADLATAKQTIATLTGENEKLKANLAAAQEALKQTKAEAPDQAAAEAAKIVAKIGLQTPVKQGESAQTEDDLWEAFGKIKNPDERAKFWAANKAKLTGK